MARDQASAGGPNPLLEAALAHARAGRPVFPCGPHKRPLIRRADGGQGLHDASRDAAQIRAWWQRYPQALIGMPTGAPSGLWVLDVDRRPDKPGDQTLSDLEDQHGRLPETWQALTQSGGWHLYFSLPTDGRRVVSRASQLGPGLDVRGEGGYVILPPSVGASGRYEWEASSDPDDGGALAAAPEWLLALVCAPLEVRAPAAAASAGRLPSRREAESALALLSPDGYDLWVQMGMALHACGAEWAFDVWDAWSQRSPKYQGDALAAKWASFGRQSGIGVSLGTLFALAREAGWERPVVRSQGPIAEAPPLEAYAEEVAPPRTARPALKVVAGRDHDPRPVIQLEAGRLPEIVDDAEHYLIEHGGGLYQHGTRLVRVGRWELAPGPVERPSGAGVLIDVSPDWLKERLTRLIRWERFDARTKTTRASNCTSEIANTLLGRSGEWRFPRLTGFLDSPTLDSRGRLIAAPGYDAPSGLYLVSPPQIGAIGEIGADDIRWARETLAEPVAEFPWCTPADHAAWVALVLTALVRRSLPSAPIGCLSATTPATGKSKLAAMISMVATGRTAPVAALGQTPEELEKRIDSVLLKGDLVVNFDNVDRAVKSDVLCQAATEAAKTVRVMGLSKVVEAPTNLLLLMTGNNLTLVGDLVRRCIVCNLDAKVERPELREFSFDPVAEVERRRTELIRAALVLALGYQQAGCPPVEAPPFGSFELWDRMVRRALIWCGYADPLAPAEGMREQDHELAGMRDFLEHWARVAPEPVSAQRLAELIRERVDMGLGDWRARHPELQEAAIQVMGDLGKWGARELGYRLRSLAGRIFGGRRVAKGGRGAEKVTAWRVESV